MRSIRKPTVVGVGEVLWDCLPTGRVLGGAPANIAYHARSLGAAGVVVSAVGADELGQEIRTRLSAQGLDTKHLAETKDQPTGAAFVELGPDGQPHFTIATPAAWDFIPWSQKSATLAKKCDAVCFGSLAQRGDVSRDTIRRFVAAVPPQGLRVFDVNLRQNFAGPEVVRQSLELATVFKLNDEELPKIARMLNLRTTEEEGCIRELMATYPLRYVALTKGAAGSVIYAQDEVSVCAGEKVVVADTVGAGDAFTAALVMGLLEQQPLAVLHRRAARIAGYVCSRPGATPALNEQLIQY